MKILAGYEPKEPLSFFEELCAIPHGSANTKAISDYCVKFAEDRQLACIQDADNNVIITKEATAGYEEKDTIIIQGHLDMVCEKVAGSDFDFMTDGLILEVNDGWISAQGTTLGGDDGIAIAIALAILDAKDIPHPKIEAVFTVDEETGLLGAKSIDLSSLTGHKLINIDAEDDSQIITSCAGATFLECHIPVEYVKAQGIEYIIELKGLLGGHSGAEIHKGRGSSNILMGRTLYYLKDFVEVSDVHGGNADNVIPNYTTAVVVVQKENETAMLEKLAQIEADMREEYVITDPGLCIVATAKGVTETEVVDAKGKVALLNALMNLPNGIQAMSSSIPGLVETSTNMGVFVIKDGVMTLNYNVRSSIESAKRYLADRTIAMVEALGGTVDEHGDYPGWAYRIDSSLRDTVVKVYTKINGKEPEVGAVHAGLECGLFTKKIDDLDCVSIGPNLIDIHSVNERMEIASVERTWKLVLGVLAD